MSTKLQKDFINIIKTKKNMSELQNTKNSEILIENKSKLEVQFVELTTTENNIITSSKLENNEENVINIQSGNNNHQSLENSNFSPQSKLPYRSISNELLPSLQALNIASHCSNDACNCRKTNKRHGSVLQSDTPIIKLPRNDLINPSSSSILNFNPNSKLLDFSTFLPNDFDFTKASTLPKNNFSRAGSIVRITNSLEFEDIIDCKGDLVSTLNNESINFEKSTDGILDLSEILKVLPPNIAPQTCSQQALAKPSMDDCSISELSAYFDNFCYIPKNMSDMAKMMYA